MSAVAGETQPSDTNTRVIAALIDAIIYSTSKNEKSHVGILLLE